MFKARFILAAVVAFAVSAFAVASPTHTDEAVFGAIGQVVGEQGKALDLTAKQAAVKSNTFYLTALPKDPVVAAHYTFTRELPSDVVFVAGNTVVDIAPRLAYLSKSKTLNRAVNEVGWRASNSYSF